MRTCIAHLHTYMACLEESTAVSVVQGIPQRIIIGATYKAFASFFSSAKSILQNLIWYNFLSILSQAYGYQYWRNLNIRWGFCLSTHRQTHRYQDRLYCNPKHLGLINLPGFKTDFKVAFTLTLFNTLQVLKQIVIALLRFLSYQTSVESCYLPNHAEKK